MTRYTYERLSAQDAAFLWAEKPNQPMHIGALAILEAGPLQRADGSIDIDRYRRRVESVLHWIPRYRQKIEWTPIERWPVWIDDRQFEIGYHIRHIALPKPGTQDQLREMAARIHARALDRRHALWEIWVIEGLGGGEQFAVLNKIHHCMLDGAAGADISQILFSPSPKEEEGEMMPYMPRPAPSRLELWADSVSLGASRPLGLVKSGLRSFSEKGSSVGDKEAGGPPPPSLDRRLRAIKSFLEQSMGAASATPLNGEIGPHRRFEWLTMSLGDVRDIRKVFGCTINDVVLATVTEAVRRTLFRRRVDHRGIDFRVSIPVSTRRDEHDRRQGNHVSTWVVPLPLSKEGPVEQIHAIRETTEALKANEASLAFESVMDWAEWIPGPLLARGLGSITSAGPVNMIVTNVPGPQFPLYTAGAKLLGMYPIVPLLPGSGLGIALFSYEGKLCWGFNADFELVPDLKAFVEDLLCGFERLRQASVTTFMDNRTARVEEPTEEPAQSTPRTGRDARPTEPRPRTRAKSGNAKPRKKKSGRVVRSKKPSDEKVEAPSRKAPQTKLPSKPQAVPQAKLVAVAESKPETEKETGQRGISLAR